MDDSEETMNCSNHEYESNDADEKLTVSNTEKSPLGISRYGRTRKPKISQDFCDIDDAINDNTDEDFIKPSKTQKTPIKPKAVHTNINGVHASLKEVVNKPKNRTLHNNNTEIVHITGDSDISNTLACEPKESVQESQKIVKVIAEKPKLPVTKNISVTKEKIPEITDKKLTEELKPILSEEIFQTPSINVAEVFKIISNKPNEADLELTAKSNSKGVVKTYANKRKSFQKQSMLIESFGLPDEPIVPVNNDEYIKPIRISEIDVDIVKPETVNLIDRELIDSLWKIGSTQDDYCCHTNSDIGNISVFDIRSRFTPDKDICDENLKLHRNNEAEDNKRDIKRNYANAIRSQSKNKILRSNTEENVISTPKLKSEKTENENKEEKQIIIKRIINKHTDVNKVNEENENSLFLNITDPLSTHKKEKVAYTEDIINNFPIKSEFLISTNNTSQKGICELVYERGKDTIIKKESKTAIIEDCDIEDHIKASLIDKSKKKEVVERDTEEKKIFASGIDINKLKNQINSRIEMMKVEESSENDNLQATEMETEAVPVVEAEVPVEIVVESVEKVVPTIPESKPDPYQAAPGDLMWAKIGNYPYWPCLITKDPLTKEYKKNRSRHVTSYHVRFFGDNGRRSWIPARYLLPYATDLSTVKVEVKNQIIIPSEGTKSYIQWMIGCEEANSLKTKTKRQKFQFFKQMFLKKRHNRKPKVEISTKLSKVVSMKAKGIAKRTIRKKLIEPIGTEKLRNEILENLADLLTTKDSKRITRSSFHSGSPTKSFGVPTEIKEESDTEIVDDDSKKNDSSSQSSEDELSSKSFFPLTLEAQTALYKRNNLFKGVSKERVCQICEKPDSIVKCKGRCNGYYHVYCANRKASLNTSLTNSIDDSSIDTEDSQLGDDCENQVEIVNKTKENLSDNENALINGDGQVVTPKASKDTDQLDKKLGNDEFKDQKEDKKMALRTRRKSRNCTTVSSDGTNLKTEDDKIEESKEGDKLVRKSRGKSRNYYNPDIPHRITRSHSQEIVPGEIFETKRRIVKSQRNSISADLEEIDISLLVNSKIKDEMQSDKKVCEIALYDIKHLNDLKENPNKLKREIEDAVSKIENSALEIPTSVSERRETRSTFNADAANRKDEVADVKHAKKLMEINTKDNKENSHGQHCKKPEPMRNCNVKIVHIKDRKKTGTSPKLTLNRDPEFDKLSLHDQIDRKMNEIMKKFEKKPLYADSTTDYTSSEESTFDLLSPQGRKLLVDSLSQSISPTTEIDDEVIINMINTIEKKTMPIKSVKHNKNDQQQNDIDFKCADCQDDVDHPCFVCHKNVSRKGSSIRQKCSLFACGKFYHPECLKVWPQTQWSVISTMIHKESNTNLDTFVCPVHVCHTCVSDDPRAAIPRCTSDKVVKCLRCPATYHNSAYCVPAGTEILSFAQIICPRHLMSKRVHKKALPIINTTWCFICSEGGDLVCCETCPTSVHSECLKINLTEDDTFICEDCETGRFPLYDEIVWVKLGSYRWWPGIVMFPNEIPDRVKMIKHNKGEFVIKFFGTYDHYWVGRGRVFLFQEGDSAEVAGSSLKKTDAVFKKSIQEAIEAHRIKRDFKQAITEEAAIKSKYKPPHYIKIKVNRPVGNVRQFDGNISNTTPCECNRKHKNPCGADSDCLNRLLLTECNPEVCPAGEKCQNQNFEKRSYPPLVPYKTESRGWGLKSLEAITKGQFVIEYVGEMIDEQEYQRRIKKMHAQKEENYYFLTIDKDRMLDAGPKGNVARFMNHSCQPNCETQKWTVNGDTRVGLFAVDDIAENTELTFNYNLECVGKEKKICKCGAPNCSGFIGVKVKQEEVRKRSKSKLKHRRKKSSLPEPANKKPCFVCGENGDVTPCNNKICTKSYHLQCVNLDSPPDNKWVCPWHKCNICTKRTIRCCVKCLNSYCPVHSEGNIRYDRLLGFICLEHDPIKADLQENNIDSRTEKDKSPILKITEENDVTSTTSDEQDQVVPKQPPNEPEGTPKQLSDNEDVITSTPMKLPDDTETNNQDVPIVKETDPDEIELEILSSTRKRGRPRKDEGSRTPYPKRIKLKDEIGTKPAAEVKKLEKRLSPAKEVTSNNTAPARRLRTAKPVNYRGVSEKSNVAQKKIKKGLNS